MDADHQGSTIPIATYHFPKEVFLPEYVPETDAQRSITIEGGFLENFKTCLQACASHRELFPCWGATDPTKRMHVIHPFEGMICDGSMLGSH